MYNKVFLLKDNKMKDLCMKCAGFCVMIDVQLLGGYILVTMQTLNFLPLTNKF